MNRIRTQLPWGTIGLTLMAAMVLSSCDSDQSASSHPLPTHTQTAPAQPDPRRESLREQANRLFGPLPSQETKDGEAASIHLGRMLYFDPRLSQDKDIACNSCHTLSNFGVDNLPTSPGHQGQNGLRNTPTVYNAALHIAQSWDGGAADISTQVRKHLLNPAEMAIPSEGTLVTSLASIQGYPELFTAVFPEQKPALTFDNIARAIASFTRGLVTPDRFDAFMQGDLQALSDPEVSGLELFIQTGCATCHSGPALGGRIYQKPGLLEAYPTQDIGRQAVTGRTADKGVFKVPGLRNVARTGPYFHDGSVTRLVDAIQLMAKHQLGRSLGDADIASIAMFLESLTGTPDGAYISKPDLPSEKLTIGPAGKS